MKKTIPLEQSILTENFIKEINRLMSNGIDCMDAIVAYCSKNSIEIESVVPIIKSNSKLKSELRISAENANYLQKNNRLPI